LFTPVFRNGDRHCPANPGSCGEARNRLKGCNNEIMAQTPPLKRGGRAAVGPRKQRQMTASARGAVGILTIQSIDFID
jgi:hypothetical protein